MENYEKNLCSHNTGDCNTSDLKTKQEWWDKLLGKDKQRILSLSNFDADIFEKCTGIRV